MNSPFREGCKAAIPIALSFISSFIAVGIFLRQAGFSIFEASVATVSIFAAPAQYGIAQSLNDSPDWFSILFLVLVINSRFLVMSATLVPSFRFVPLWRLMVAAPLLSASTFSVTQVCEDRDDAFAKYHYFLGVGLTSYLSAIVATFAGSVMVDVAPSISRAWLTMILPLFFAAQMGVHFKVSSRMVPFALGLVITLVLYPWLGGSASLWAAIIVGLVSTLYLNLRK